jgi:hypothetical protein
MSLPFIELAWKDSHYEISDADFSENRNGTSDSDRENWSGIGK